MKAQQLLYGPFTKLLPNFRLVDFDDKPSTLVDFTVPTEGYEAPWGMAKLNFIYDSARVAETPGSIRELLEWAQAHPGRFTYPAPPDFLGSRSEEHTSELQSLMRISYAVFCLKKKKKPPSLK